MVWLFAGLYLVAAVMSFFLRGTQPGFDGVPARDASHDTGPSAPSSEPALAAH